MPGVWTKDREDARNLAPTTALPNNSTPKPFKGTVTAANADGTVEVRYTDKSEYTMKLSELLRATHSLESYMCILHVHYCFLIRFGGKLVLTSESPTIANSIANSIQGVLHCYQSREMAGGLRSGSGPERTPCW